MKSRSPLTARSCCDQTDSNLRRATSLSTEFGGFRLHWSAPARILDRIRDPLVRVRRKRTYLFVVPPRLILKWKSKSAVFAIASAALLAAPRSSKGSRLTKAGRGRHPRAAEFLPHAIDDYAHDLDLFLALMQRDSEILIAINGAVDELKPREAHEPALAVARSRLEQASRIASADPMAGEELRRKIATGGRSCAISANGSRGHDLATLVEDLHHSVVHAAVSTNLADIARARDGLMELISITGALNRTGAELNSLGVIFESQRFASGLPRAVRSGRSLQPAVIEFQREVQQFLTRARLEREIEKLAIDASEDLDTFQNAIGLDKALDRLKEADEKSSAVEVDPEFRKAILWTEERLKTLLLSPSSTDMKALREALHHRLLHRAALVDAANSIAANERLARHYPPPIESTNWRSR